MEFPGPSRVALALGISLVAKCRALALNSDQVSRLRGRAVQQTSQLERVWDVLFWEEGPTIGFHPTFSGITAMPSHFKKCAILTGRPIQAWCNLARWPKEPLPHSSFCSSGLKELCDCLMAPLVA